MKLGYVTNGFSNHRLEDAIRILADVGYQSVAITLDTHQLNPFAEDWPVQVDRGRDLLDSLRMSCVVETGARFLLDPRRKHQPTLVSADEASRGGRIAFLCRAVDMAAELNASCVSLWSGWPDDEADETVAWDRLISGLVDVVDHAALRGVRLAFEPEPGMLVETMADFQRLREAIDHPALGLTLDIGHVYCLNDGDLYEHVTRFQDRLWNIHIEDMRRGVHEHLFFGDGEMNFAETIGILTATGCDAPVHVELSRHSHDAPDVADRAFKFLNAYWPR